MRRPRRRRGGGVKNVYINRRGERVFGNQFGGGLFFGEDASPSATGDGGHGNMGGVEAGAKTSVAREGAVGVRTIMSR